MQSRSGPIYALLCSLLYLGLRPRRDWPPGLLVLYLQGVAAQLTWVDNDKCLPLVQNLQTGLLSQREVDRQRAAPAPAAAEDAGHGHAHGDSLRRLLRLSLHSC